MRMQQVSSSMVNAVGYDKKNQTLCVDFNGGKTYEYYDVPIEVYEGLADAGSVGRYLNSEVKGKYS